MLAMIPDSERARLEALVQGRAAQYGLTPTDYLRKVWYHEQASRIGEYAAMVFMEELLKASPWLTMEEVAP